MRKFPRFSLGPLNYLNNALEFLEVDVKHSQVSQRCQIEEVSYALVFNSNLPFAKAIPNVQLFQIPNGRALIYQPWCNGQDNVTNIIMDSKNLSLSSSNRSFEGLRKLTIECILVFTSFKVTMSLKKLFCQSIYHKLFHWNIIVLGDKEAKE